MIVINLMNTGNRAKAEKIQKALEGQTYMKFHITLCPYQGEYIVNAETDYPCNEAVAYGMLLMLLSDMISR